MMVAALLALLSLLVSTLAAEAVGCPHIDNIGDQGMESLAFQIIRRAIRSCLRKLGTLDFI